MKLNKIHSSNSRRSQNSLLAAIHQDNLIKFNQLVGTGAIIPSHAILIAVRNKSFELTKLLVEKYNYRVDGLSFDLAMENQDFKFVKYFYSQCGFKVHHSVFNRLHASKNPLFVQACFGLFCNSNK